MFPYRMKFTARGLPKSNCSENHLTRGLFEPTVRRIEALPLPAAYQKLWKQTIPSERRQAPETCLEESAAPATGSVSEVIYRKSVSI